MSRYQPCNDNVINAREVFMRKALKDMEKRRKHFPLTGEIEMIRYCECGCEVFYVTPSCIICKDCQEEQVF